MNAKEKSFTAKTLAMVVGALALALVLSTPVEATLQVSVTVYDTANPIVGYSNVIVDGGVGDVDGLVNNQILLGNNFQPIANFIVQGSFHTSKTAGLDLLTSGSSSVNNNRATTTRAYVAVGDTDFTPPANFVSVTGSGTFTNAVGSTIALGYYDDPANVQGANLAFADLADFLANAWKLTPGNLVDSYSYNATGGLDSFSYNNSSALAFPDLNPFSMTLLFDFNLTAGGQLTSRGQSMFKTEVPEPATILLIGSGLVGIVAFRRKLRK